MELLPEGLIVSLIKMIPLFSLILTMVISSILLYTIKHSRQEEEKVSGDIRIANAYREAEFLATEILKDATEKGKRIIQDAALTKDSLDARLEKSLSQMNEQLTQKIATKEEDIYSTYKKVFETISQSYQNEGSRIVTGFKEEGETMLKTYIQTMHAEINSVREQIFQNLDAKMAVVEEDLQKYRDEQKLRIDQNVKKAAKSTMENYMRGSLGYENQEGITFKVLEKFAKDTTSSPQT